MIMRHNKFTSVVFSVHSFVDIRFPNSRAFFREHREMPVINFFINKNPSEPSVVSDTFFGVIGNSLKKQKRQIHLSLDSDRRHPAFPDYKILLTAEEVSLQSFRQNTYK